MLHDELLLKKISRKLDSTKEIKKAEAAVAVILETTENKLETLLVKRAKTPGDPWSGQMAFPGGKRDSKDRDIIETVVRETMEETSINLNHSCRFLGALPSLKSAIEPKLLVTPFIILLERNQIVGLNKELERYFWVPLEKLQKSRGTTELSFGKIPAYFVEGTIVWGLTYRILEKLTQILEQVTSGF